MAVKRFVFDRVSIRTRLLVWFMLLSFVPCLVLTGIVTWISKRSVEKLVKSNLTTISVSKARDLETFALERRRDIKVFSRSPLLVNETVALIDALKKEPADRIGDKKHTDAFRAYMRYAASTLGYDNMYLFSPDGDLLFRIYERLPVGKRLTSGELKDSEFAKVFDRAKTLLQADVSDYATYEGLSQPAAFAACPIFSERTMVGVVVFQLNNTQIYKIVGDSTGLGETGESVLGSLVREEVVIVAPMRSDPDAAFMRRVKMGGDRGNAIQQAVQGKRGFGPSLDSKGKETIAAWMYVPSFRWGLIVRQDPDEAYALIARQRTAVLLLLSLMAIPVLLVALSLAGTITRPIIAAASVANRVAEGDLTQELDIRAPGESGQLIAAIGTMICYLRSLIGSVQKSSISLLSTATEIAATSRQQELTVDEYGASTSQAAAATKEISATSLELLKTMNELNELAIETAGRAAEGQGGLSNMGDGMRLLADSTGSISSKLSIISERAANINLVVTTITKVADQTNLLSINAAIEAEKAGEYGLGFLVVAREIRRLADQTAVATLDIERMVKEMQSSVSAGVMEMDKFSDQVRRGVSDVETISDQLIHIIQDVQGLTSRFDHVTEGMRVQSQGAEQIREAMIQISDGAIRTKQSLREFNSATSHLRDAVSSLKDEISRFSIADSPVQQTALRSSLGSL